MLSSLQLWLDTRCFEAILPAGTAVQTSLEVVSLAARLTDTDRRTRVLWAFVEEAGTNFKAQQELAGMMPINDARQISNCSGRQARLGNIMQRWRAAQGAGCKQLPEGLFICFSNSAANRAAWTSCPGQQLPDPNLCHDLRWGARTYSLAVAHAEPQLARHLLGHPRARAASNEVPASCPPKRMLHLVCSVA